MRYQVRIDKVLEDYLILLASQKHEPTRGLIVGHAAEMFSREDDLKSELLALNGLGKLNWPAIVSEAMRACYESPTEILRHLKDELIEHLKNTGIVNVQRCPYCMLNEPNTWDHFLPKSAYPEFSISLVNLVYVCWGCNHRKGDSYSESHLEYCHPGFTVDEQEPVLHCRVMITGGRLKIDFYCGTHQPGHELSEIAERHMRNLDLFRRYKLECASVFSSFIGGLARDCPVGVAAHTLADSIQRRFEDVQVDFGVNAWEARFWHGVMNCPDILGYVNDRIRNHSPVIRQGLDIAAPPPA